MNIGIFVFHKLEFDFCPFAFHNLDLFAHLKLLFRSVGDIFDLVFEIEQLQVPNGLNLQFVVNLELLIDQNLDFGPMTTVLHVHGGVLEFIQ